MSLGAADDRDFEVAISRYPSSFDLKLDSLKKSRIRIVRDTLLGKLKNGFVFHFEETQVYNLISYLSYVIGEFEVSVDYNNKALVMDKRNGIALANRARFNRHQFNFYDADRDLKYLERLYGADNAAVTIKVLSEGELAQSYARFGPKFHEIAISKYESIFEGNPLVKTSALILWKYDYCLCLRRTLNLFNKSEYPDRDDTDTLRKSSVILSDIIDASLQKINNPGFTIYAARAWAELGYLIYHLEKNPATCDVNIRDCIPIQKRYMSSQSCFDRALALGDGDFDVMELCAKFYRYFDRTDEAICLFEKALRLRQTSLCYHHLALSLRKLELHKVNEQRNQRLPWQQKRFPSSRGRKQTLNTPQQREQSHVKRSIKCGRNATQLQSNDQTRKILTNLDMAIALDPCNHYASYDKGFLFRQLQRTEEAKVVFCKLLNNLEPCELKISCYEQAAYCCLDMAKTNSPHSKRYTHDAICFLHRAIEVAATLASTTKYTASVRSLIPTVNKMLSNPELIKSHDSHMQRLQYLLIEYGSLLPLTKEAKSVDVKNTITLLEKCLQEDRLDEAAFLSILNTISSESDEKKFLEHLTTILMVASTSLSNKEYEAAKTRYQIWYWLMKFRIGRNEMENDVFLMTDDESENLKPLYVVSDWLDRYCGLSTVNSDEHCTVGEQILLSYEHFCQSSAAVLVVLRSPKIEDMVKTITTAIISMEEVARPKLVILKDRLVKLPIAWTNIPKVLLPQEEEIYNESTISSWISQVFKAIIE